MTSGFYKFEKELYYGTEVLNNNYHLTSDNKYEYDYPIDGWYWFDCEEEAKEFFEIKDINLE